MSENYLNLNSEYKDTNTLGRSPSIIFSLIIRSAHKNIIKSKIHPSKQ